MSSLRRWRHALWLRALERCPRNALLTRIILSGLAVLAYVPGMGFFANHCRGQVYAAIGFQQRAVHCYETALARGPLRDPTLHHHLGVALAALGRHGDARAHLLQSIERKPGAWWSYTALGELMLQQGRLPDAQTFLRRSIALHNADPWAYYHLYEAEHARVGREAALMNWLDAVLAAPPMPELSLNIGLLWLEQGSYTAAHVEKLRRVAQRYPANQPVRFFLGCLLSQLGQGSAASESLSQYMAQAWQRYCGATAAAPGRVKDPEFLIIGTAKSGSSALYDYLVDHPLVCPAVVKEVSFWTTYYSHGCDWYRACFMPIPASAPQITGEGSIRSLWDEDAPRRVAAFRQDMKLLLILREPVARAYSEYHMRQRLGEAMPAWDALVEQELAMFPQCPLAPDELPRQDGGNHLLVNSAVLGFLRRWLRHFPARQFLVLRSEDLRGDATGTVNLAYRFLGLPPHRPAVAARSNVGTYPPLNPELERRLRQWYQPHQRALEKFLATEMG